MKLPKYNPDSEFERRITNQHQWQVVHDGGPEQCTQCGCWDPSPIGMPAYSMAPKECDGNNLADRKLEEVMTIDEEIEHLFTNK